MADDITLRLGAEVEAAASKIESVHKKLAALAAEVKGGTPVFDAYGKVASQATDKVDEAGKKAAKSTGLLSDGFGKLVGAFSAASLLEKGVSALVGIGTAAFTSSSRILDLRDTTGLTTTTLQQFAHVEKVTGTATDALAMSAYKLMQNIAGGDKSVVAGVSDLGLSFDDLFNASPDEKFYKVTDALRSILDPQERNRLAVLLLGKTWQEIAPAVVGGIRAIGNEASVATDRQLEAMDRAQRRWREGMSTVEGGLVKFGAAIFQQFDAAGAKIDAAWELMSGGGFAGADAAMQKYRFSLLSTQEQVDRLTVSQKQHIKEQIEGGKTVAQIASGDWGMLQGAVVAYANTLEVKAKPAARNWSQELATAQAQLRDLSAEKVKDIEVAKKSGLSTDELTKQFGLNALALKLLEERQQASTKATEEATRTQEQRRAIADKVRLADVALSEQTQKDILVLQKKGLTEAEIATHLKVNEVQVGKVIDAEKLRTKVIEEQLEAAIKAAKTQADLAAAERARVEKDGVERMQKAEQLYGLLMENERAVALLQTSGHTRRLLELSQSESAEIASLHKTHDATAKETQDVEALIRRRYQHERDLANATESTIVERMRAQGVLTRDEQAATVAALELEYRQMVTSHRFSVQEIEAAERRWRQAQAEMSHAALFRFMSEMDKGFQIANAAFNAIGGLGSETASKIVDVGSRIVSVAQQGSQAMAAFATGQWVQGAIASIGAIGTALKGMFSGNETKKAREEFAAGMDLTLDQLYKKLQSMGAEGQRLANQALNVIGKHDEAGNKRWMNEVSAFFESHQESLAREQALVDEATLSWQEAEELMREFGISATNSGKALEQAKITEQGDDIAVKWRQLVAAGIDFTDVTTGMADEMQELINRSLSLGIELPASLRKPAEEMIKLGLLTDENGNKLTDMGQLTFAETLTDKVGQLVDKLTIMLSKIFGIEDASTAASQAAKKNFDGVGDSAQSLSERIHKHLGGLSFTVPVTIDDPTTGGGDHERSGIPGFSKGSDGIRDFKDGTLAMLHGEEGVYTKAQIGAVQQSAVAQVLGMLSSFTQRAQVAAEAVGLTAMAGAGGGVGRAPVQVIANIDGRGAFFTSEQGMRDLVRRVGDGVVDELNLRGIPIVGLG